MGKFLLGKDSFGCPRAPKFQNNSWGKKTYGRLKVSKYQIDVRGSQAVIWLHDKDFWTDIPVPGLRYILAAK